MDLRHVLVMALTMLAAAALADTFTPSGSTLQKMELTEAEDVVSRDIHLSRHHRTKRQLRRNPGIFGLLFQFIGETRRDIQKTFNDIARELESSLVDENTIENSTAEAASGREAASSETPRITRQEVMRILGRNWRGLTRLFNQEVEIALNQSNRSAAQARTAFWNSLTPFLEPATTTARSNATTRSG